MAVADEIGPRYRAFSATSVTSAITALLGLLAMYSRRIVASVAHGRIWTHMK